MTVYLIAKNHNPSIPIPYGNIADQRTLKVLLSQLILGYNMGTRTFPSIGGAYEIRMLIQNFALDHSKQKLLVFWKMKSPFLVLFGLSLGTEEF